MEKNKILVVDDEARRRKLVKDFLVKNDYEVIEAEDGSAALDLFYEDKSISLIILDVMMPKMDGYGVTREIRRTSDVPIIILTILYKNLFPMISTTIISSLTQQLASNISQTVYGLELPEFLKLVKS